jgi:hypothetical protein
MDSWRDMDMATDNVMVIDRASGVQYYIGAYRGSGIYAHAGTYHGSRRNLNTTGDG